MIEHPGNAGISEAILQSPKAISAIVALCRSSQNSAAISVLESLVKNGLFYFGILECSSLSPSDDTLKAIAIETNAASVLVGILGRDDSLVVSSAVHSLTKLVIHGGWWTLKTSRNR